MDEQGGGIMDITQEYGQKVVIENEYKNAQDRVNELLAEGWSVKDFDCVGAGTGAGSGGSLGRLGEVHFRYIFVLER
jgi:hypothetical protein